LIGTAPNSARVAAIPVGSFGIGVRPSSGPHGQPREKRSVGGKSARQKFRKQPHALRLAGLALREKPERSVHVKVGARHPR